MIRKILDAKEVAARAAQLRETGKSLVFTNGCFDLLHVGHVRYLAAARALGDVLMVGVNGDESVRALKGANRPINNERDRAEVLAALESVDLVTIFPELRATQLLTLVRPNVYVKGGDYTPETLNPEERAVLDRIGSEIQIIPYERDYSTSRIIERLGTSDS
jgi:D-beta-D-heptose 7-phosphate kinase/D-beta-D-heptose 1-phosphate adenosyltransferase